MSDSTALPVIDLADFDAPETRDAALDRLRTVTHEIGFFHLAGHGIDPAAADRLIAASREFFALPDAAKLEVENSHSPHFRGYTRVGGERTQGHVDWREQLDIGPERDAVAEFDPARPWEVLHGPNLWPAQVPQLRPAAAEWMDRLQAVGLRLLRAWAESLGAPADFFDEAFAHPDPLLKIVRYPGHDRSVTDQGVGSHKDVGALTLLYPEPGSTGFQVQRDGAWFEVDPLPGHLLVNIGELLEVATGGYLTATVHRVEPPSTGTDRVSLPFFLNPALDKALPTLPLPDHLAAAARGVGHDAHGGALHAVYGLNALKSRLRAHPNVTDRYHAELLRSFELGR
ncbi:2-oxoglutarate and iron-dependent oxygenase domain-containing protein [Rhodococcus sp. (in: high G+C Gram-positive bacteria)]|uniref:isopenicillin N synthase family dioxygenase n=1 Tax=Rhodococcus sp. TaxID=1831 RepID=UPI001A0E0953|nr:2-oxoglutarate and iron-dependent oxygenase domain-containing protein [Rhodococcus sp. (in: high G+C Gram-positive bacteria)]MBF0662150.1 isopenicillin N synthase family oxygenase [Rhodococcus sp. (in: high G+C Gram-positive bacteria)]